jgi:hypothetical protein
MKRKDIVIGLIVLAVLAGIIFWFQKPNKDLKVPETSSVEEKMEEYFNVEIPEDVEKTQLLEVGEGDGTGIATRNYENDTFIHVVLADLPQPKAPYFYEGWLVRGQEGDENFDYISTGKMRFAKGGFLLEFESSIDYLGYKGVVITQEEKEDDIPEEHVLEGAFQ